MKNLLIGLLITTNLFINPLSVQAKGGGGHSSGHSSSHSSSHSTTSHTSTTKSTTTTTRSTSTSAKSNTSFKSGIFSSSKTTKTVNTSSSALKTIPTNYSCHSVSNHYYYNTSNGGSNFWSNYWMYRALTPEHRVYVVNGTNQTAPAYTGFYSAVADIITLIVLIVTVCIIIYIIKRRKRY